MSTVGDIMSTLEDIMGTPGGYHDRCGVRSLGQQLNLYGNPSVLNIPRCTHDIPHTHHGIPQCTHGISPVYWTPPAVLMISPTLTMVSPHCTYGSPQCTEHPLVYSMISPSVLNIPRCTAQTLCRVIPVYEQHKILVRNRFFCVAILQKICNKLFFSYCACMELYYSLIKSYRQQKIIFYDQISFVLSTYQIWASCSK